MAFASVFGGAIAYGLFFSSRITKKSLDLVLSHFLTPVFALLTGGVYLDERLTVVQWLGVVLCFVSVFFC